jgi:hypothetical protein
MLPVAIKAGKTCSSSPHSLGQAQVRAAGLMPQAAARDGSTARVAVSAGWLIAHSTPRKGLAVPAHPAAVWQACRRSRLKAMSGATAASPGGAPLPA